MAIRYRICPINCPSVFKMSTTPDKATLRRATADDATALGELGAATFVETFGHLYSIEDLQSSCSNAEPTCMYAG